MSVKRNLTISLSRSFCWLVLGLATTTLSNAQNFPSVFVDLHRLVATALTEAIPPAPFRFAPMPLENGTILLSPVPLGDPIGQIAEIIRWQQEWLAPLEREHRLVTTPPLPSAMPRLALPGIPSSSEREPAFWERLQSQAFERARIQLRLAFVDRLSPAERMKLQRRLEELDAQLRLPHSPPPLLPSPEPPNFDLPLPVPLTDAEQIAALVAPPFTLPAPSVVRLDWSERAAFLRQRPDRTSLHQVALWALAQAFARAYARRQGWRVVFAPSSSAMDKTEEVLTAWRQWWASIGRR